MDVIHYDLSKLEHHRHMEARRTLIARAMLLGVIFTMLATNMWLTQRSYESLLINMDQNRLDQDRLQDLTDARMRDLESRVAELQQALDERAAQDAMTSLAAEGEEVAALAMQ